MRRLTVLMLALLAAGCATLPTPPAPQVDWPARQAELLALDGWRLTGRVAVNVDGEGGSASLDWRQSGATSDLSLSGPLGAGSLRAVLDAAGLRLEDGSGSRLAGEEAEQALSGRFGVTLPLQALRYWLLGVPAPGMPSSTVPGPDGRPLQFEQAGWQVEPARFQLTEAGELPTRLSATQGPARLKLAVSRWELAQ